MVLIPSDQACAPLVLALDLGTSSVRAVIYDAQGRQVTGLESRQPSPIEVSRDGAFETDPDELLEKAWRCIDEVLTKAGARANSIGGVSCCTFVSNVMGVDTRGRAITPLVLYGDTRAADQAFDLATRLDEEYFHQRTGTRFHASYLPARFLWWKQERPVEFALVQRWVSIGEYLLLKLFGDTAVSHSVASWTGLQHRLILDWDDEILSHLPVGRGELSRLVDAGDAFRGLRAEFASRWPALADALWFPAIGDGAANNIGSGCFDSSRVALSMGTSSAVRTVITTPNVRLPAGLWCYRVDRKRSLLGGAMTEGGSVFSWFRGLLNLDGYADLRELEAALMQMPPAASGLTFLPLISGERSPGWVSEARGIMMGLSIATTPLDLLRAGMEGVACRIALVYDLLGSGLAADVEIIASGGAIQNSPAWQQIVADALNRPVRLSQIPETSTRGSVLLALEAMGLVEDLATLPDQSILAAEPDPIRHAKYREVIAQQMEMYDKLILHK